MPCERIARHTSTPLIPGIIRSVITRSGRPFAEDEQALFWIVGGAHVESLRGERSAQTRVICGSSSITRILPGMFLLL